jgi:hypothetical protein
MLRFGDHAPASAPRAATMAAIFFLLITAASAQTPPRNNNSTPPSDPPSTKQDSSLGEFGSPESEMRAKMNIKEEKRKYDEHLARAREVSKLAEQVCDSYESHKAFVQEDGKRLERLEKLTKRIRNDAGGSDNDPDSDNIPGSLDKAVKLVAAAAKDLQEKVEKTPRNVVSAAVIDQANRLLGMVHHLRDNTH